MWFGRKPSFEVYKGLAAPIYFESVQQSIAGTEADVTIVVKDNLPSYTLRGYKLVWQTAEGTEKELKLPDLAPGKKFETQITGIDPKVKPVVKVVRPTGYNVLNYH
jgi:beta-glucuronidase